MLGSLSSSLDSCSLLLGWDLSWAVSFSNNNAIIIVMIAVNAKLRLQVTPRKKYERKIREKDNYYSS